jgi:hypothetical protein
MTKHDFTISLCYCYTPSNVNSSFRERRCWPIRKLGTVQRGWILFLSLLLCITSRLYNKCSCCRSELKFVRTPPLLTAWNCEVQGRNSLQQHNAHTKLSIVRAGGLVKNLKTTKTHARGDLISLVFFFRPIFGILCQSRIMMSVVQ